MNLHQIVKLKQEKNIALVEDVKKHVRAAMQIRDTFRVWVWFEYIWHLSFGGRSEIETSVYALPRTRTGRPAAQRYARLYV